MIDLNFKGEEAAFAKKASAFVDRMSKISETMTRDVMEYAMAQIAAEKDLETNWQRTAVLNCIAVQMVEVMTATIVQNEPYHRLAEPAADMLQKTLNECMAKLGDVIDG